MLPPKLLIQASGLNKAYKTGEYSLDVLVNADFSIGYGEKVSIVGPSGSGKTTLLQIIGLIETLDSGNLMFDGEDCTNLSESRVNEILRDKIGFIYQFHHLLPEFTVLENVIIPQLVKGINYKAATQKAESILKELGLQDKLTSLPGVLSGGQQQRVAIARATAKQPLIILADEPTGNLDPKNSEKVFEVLINTISNFNVSLLCVTHNQELAAKCDRRFTMDGGHLKVL